MTAPTQLTPATTPPAPPAALPPRDRTPGLTYTRTIDRSLVHRDSLGEVFLTDLLPLDDLSYLAAAQLPRSHAYYGDHQLSPTHHDPLLLLEAARQAALAGAHQFYGVPADHKFILTHLRIHLTAPQHLAIGPSPTALTMTVTAADRRQREGRTTGIDSHIQLAFDDTPIGHAAVGLRFKSPSDYHRLRLDNRDGRPLTSTATHRPATHGTPLTPHLAGRTDPDNVILLDTTTRNGSTHAAMRVPTTHPSMFDHPQDHLPGMVITEAARQLALYTALHTHALSPTRTLPTDLDVTFTRFGELEQDTQLTATHPAAHNPADTGIHYTQAGPLEPTAPEHRTDPHPLPIHVEARQNDQPIATLVVTLTPLRTHP